ncbi:hypothetical protein Hdeb2414_s0001g00010731 [Helianthus debilis subsp. tardiflorus]
MKWSATKQDLLLSREKMAGNEVVGNGKRLEHLKIGTGVVCRSKKNTETTIEAVAVVSELPELINPSCSRVYGSKTEVRPLSL